MRKIGLVGGISWTSTLDYYRYINEGVNQVLGGLESAECIVYSLNFAELQQKGWENSFDLLLQACENLKTCGVEGIVLCANTAHMFASGLQEKTGVPIIHIITATAMEIQMRNLQRVGLLGTKFTMQMPFYQEVLEQYGIEVLVPGNDKAVEEIHEIVKDELGKGTILGTSKEKLMAYVHDLIQRGAQGIILGCTEIPLTLGQGDFGSIPVFDTTKIHVEHIVDFMINPSLQ